MHDLAQNAATSTASATKKKLKKKEAKKSLAERLAGTTPFDWLKVDASLSTDK